VIIAEAYETGGATCVSVLTDTPYFQGSDDDLMYARAGIRLPVLRKDFILDPYQVIESRAIGADCILLIMAALEDAQAKELEAQAIELGMDVLVEVHNAQELERALKHMSSTLIGINNRNLKTQTVDLYTSEQLVYGVPKTHLCVSESGIKSTADVQRLRQSNIHCFLVGESLLLQRSIAQATREMMGQA